MYIDTIWRYTLFPLNRINTGVKMKKFVFVFVFIILRLTLSAADIKDTWFDTFCDAAAKQIPKGCMLRKVPGARIIFIDMPLPVKSDSTFDVKRAKEAIVKSIKNTPDMDFIRKAEITCIYNYITTDYKIYSVVINKNDF